MSMILEQVSRLRYLANDIGFAEFDKSLAIELRQAADTIEALSTKLARINMEQSKRYYSSGWIPCEDGLPDDGVDVLVWFEYFRYGNYNRLFQTTGISYTYDGKWSGFVNGDSGWSQLRIIGWQPLPEPYQPYQNDKMVLSEPKEAK